MTRLRVRDVEALRQCMESSRRVVPHSVRSLAALVGANRSKIGYLLTGERPHIDEPLAQRIAVALGVKVDDLFVPDASPFVNEAGERATAPDSEPRAASDEESK